MNPKAKLPRETASSTSASDGPPDRSDHVDQAQDEEPANDSSQPYPRSE
jgi:hypothetical protein